MRSGTKLSQFLKVSHLLFPMLSSNIPSATAFGVYVSQLIRYARACCKYQGFVDLSRNIVSLSDTGFSFSLSYTTDTWIWRMHYNRQVMLTTRGDLLSLQDFVNRDKLLSNKLWSQDYRKAKLVSIVKKFYERHPDVLIPPFLRVGKKSLRN